MLEALTGIVRSVLLAGSRSSVGRQALKGLQTSTCAPCWMSLPSTRARAVHMWGPFACSASCSDSLGNHIFQGDIVDSVCTCLTCAHEHDICDRSMLPLGFSGGPATPACCRCTIGVAACLGIRQA